MNVSFLQELLNQVAEQGRALLPKALFGSDGGETIEGLARALMSVRGEASGVAIARQLLKRLADASVESRAEFFRYLSDDLQPDPCGVAAAAQHYLDAPSEAR